MNDEQLLRYSRHILLDEIGIEGQQRLLDRMRSSSAPAAWARRRRCTWAAPASAPSRVVDHDSVDLTNLQRQIAHDHAASARRRRESAAQSIAASTPTCRCARWCERADAALLDALVAEADVVLDCSDNFATRQAVNAACVRTASRWWPARRSASRRRSRSTTRATRRACYACLFPADAAFEEVRCATMGVFAPLVGIIGSVQAAEALKLLAGVGPFTGRSAADARRSHDGMDARSARAAAAARLRRAC